MPPIIRTIGSFSSCYTYVSPGILMGKERSEQPESSESQQPLYCWAVSFPDDTTSESAYFQAQHTIFLSDCDVSVFRFGLHGVRYVAVIGQPPPADLDAKLRDVLSTGAPASLPNGILGFLAERRRHAQRLGPWVEGHYRQGDHRG